METYGACERTASGKALPRQTVFDPRRSIETDGVARDDLVLTCALTLVKDFTKFRGGKPLEKSGFRFGALTGSAIESMEPGDTMVLQMDLGRDREILRRWLRHADTLIGMNLQYDLLYLRCVPEFRFVLDGNRHTILDVSILNYLHDETRPERSLKAIGPVLGTHRYGDETLRGGHRFESPRVPGLIRYNAQDAHNAVLACAELARRIRKDYPGSDKLSARCLKFYSDNTWLAVRMSEAGFSVDLEGLQAYEDTLVRRCHRAHRVALGKFGVPLEGPGSGKAKKRFLDLTCDVVDGAVSCANPQDIERWMCNGAGSPLSSSSEGCSPSSSEPSVSSGGVRDHPLLQVTPKRKEISFSEENRNLLSSLVPGKSPLRRVYRLAKKHASAQKLLSSYTFPLLHHRRNRPLDKSSVVLPRTRLAHPHWYITPSYAKEGAGSAGGTLQGRITCKGPSRQTFPKQIKRFLASRFGDEGLLVWFDLSQVELRVAALLSGDPGMLRAYREGLDLHQERADQIFGPGGSGGFERQVGKTVNFAELYLAGPERIQRTVLEMTGRLLDLEFCKEIVRDQRKMRPGLVEWQRAMQREANERGYLELPVTGQTRHFSGDEYHEIVNFPIQTTAGNTLLFIQHEMMRVMPALNEARPWVYMTGQVYDSVEFDCRRDRVEELREMFEWCVEEVRNNGYWATLCGFYGREVPLEYSEETHALPRPERTGQAQKDPQPLEGAGVIGPGGCSGGGADQEVGLSACA